MSAQLHDISGMSRLDLDMKAYTRATARMKAADQEGTLACREYHDAREKLVHDHGVSCDLELSPAFSAFYSAYKQDLAKRQGREIARSET